MRVRDIRLGRFTEVDWETVKRLRDKRKNRGTPLRLWELRILMRKRQKYISHESRSFLQTPYVQMCTSSGMGYLGSRTSVV